MTQKKDKAPLYLTIGIGLILIIAVLVFLISPSEYNGQTITGAQTIAREPASFWVFVILGFALSIGSFYLAYSIAEGVGVGKNINAPDWVPVGLVALAFILLLAPWAKACTDKANGGYGLSAYEKQMQEVIRITLAKGWPKESLIFVSAMDTTEFKRLYENHNNTIAP